MFNLSSNWVLFYICCFLDFRRGWRVSQGRVLPFWKIVFILLVSRHLGFEIYLFIGRKFDCYVEVMNKKPWSIIIVRVFYFKIHFITFYKLFPLFFPSKNLKGKWFFFFYIFAHSNSSDYVYSWTLQQFFMSRAIICMTCTLLILYRVYNIKYNTGGLTVVSNCIDVYIDHSSQNLWNLNDKRMYVFLQISHQKHTRFFFNFVSWCQHLGIVLLTFK